MDDAGMAKDLDEFDAEAKAVNTAAIQAEQVAERMRIRPPPGRNATRNQRYRPRIKLGRYYPEHNDPLDLFPLKPLKPNETTSRVSYPGHMWVPPSRKPIAPLGYVPMPRRATPPGAWVPGGHEPLNLW